MEGGDGTCVFSAEVNEDMEGGDGTCVFSAEVNEEKKNRGGGVPTPQDDEAHI